MTEAVDPEALPDGTLSKSTMRRRAAISHTPAQIEAAASQIRQLVDSDIAARTFAERALSAAEAAGWQPIESAPKDDDEVAILIGNFEYASPQCRVAYYDLEADPTYPWHVEDAAKGFNHHKDWPTHWRPLPAPPPPTGE